MVSRIHRKYIKGSLVKYADDQISSVTMYDEMEEPDVTSANSWAQIVVQVDELPGRDNDWIGSGRMIVEIGSRKEQSGAENAYYAATVAESFCTTFRDAVTITDGQNTLGVAVFDTRATTRPLGEADGIQQYYWECDFKIYTSR